MKIYHTATKEDFEDFAAKHGVPHQLKWKYLKQNTGILFEDDGFSIMDIENAERLYPEHEIVKYERDICQEMFIERLIEDHDAKKNDAVNSPSHYNSFKTEVIDTIEELIEYYPKRVNFHIGNAIKYIFRAPFKGNMKQDLEKAIWYLQRAIERL